MGVRLSIVRLPIDPAVDILTLRRWFEYVEFKRPELDRPSFHLYDVARTMEHPPRWIHLSKGYSLSYEALTGRHRGRFTSEFFHEESDDPCAWGIYGARRIGWKADGHVYEQPVKYSLPTDTRKVHSAICELTDADLRENLIQAHDNPPPDLDEYQTPTIPLDDRLHVFDEYLASRLLPVLHRFFAATQEEREIVIHWLH